jgi:hypothetical protein
MRFVLSFTAIAFAGKWVFTASQLFQSIADALASVNGIH